MRILACGEYTQLSSGYAVYMRELLQRLSRYPGVTVAEQASFCSIDDRRIGNVPWRVYPVAPSHSDKNAVAEYNSNPLNAFGGNIFNNVLLDFKPTHVIDIRDSWHIEYQFRSPLRAYYSHVPMPAIDAYPQHKTWIDMYSTADKLMSYTDWGIDVLKDAGLKNTGTSASPCSPVEYRELDKNTKDGIKQSLGLGDITIVGTVMRNQRRKLFPELFRDFSRYLNQSGRKDVYLLCHTSYPDTWELDELLIEHGIQNRVLFSYICRACGNVDVSFYRGMLSHCRKCNSINSVLPSTQYGLNNVDMNIIYNFMDVYVQYAICEGYGMPLAEAIACGVPVMGVDYSAMSEIIHQSNSTPIKPKDFFIEAETGRRMAIPDSDSFVSGLSNLLNMTYDERKKRSDTAKLLYGLRSYDTVAQKWYEVLSSTKPLKSWDAPATQLNMDIQVPQNLSNIDFARWLIVSVLQEPNKVGSFMEARLIRDLNNGYSYRTFDNRYYHEDINGKGMTLREFSREQALSDFGALLEEKNFWETQRVNRRS